MAVISKISDITYNDLIYFLRIPGEPSSDDINFLNSCINYAHSYIQYNFGIFIDMPKHVRQQKLIR